MENNYLIDLSDLRVSFIYIWLFEVKMWESSSQGVKLDDTC